MYRGMSNLPGLPVGKPIGFKTLQEITGYISVHDGNILKVTLTIGKIIKTEAKNPDGTPVYGIQHNANFTVLTKEEYDAMIKNDLKE